jgi:hypothetical protein
MADQRGWPKPLKDTVPASERPDEATVEAGIERVDEFVVEDPWSPTSAGRSAFACCPRQA